MAEETKTIFGIDWDKPVEVELKYLNEWPKNPRKITEKKFNELVEKIKRDGFWGTLLVDQDDTILSGHQRTKALKPLVS